MAWKEPRYAIICPFPDAYMWSVTVDGKLLFQHPNPGYSTFFVRPAGRERHPTLDEVAFFADCLAYDHDCPTLLRPSRQTRPLTRPLGERRPHDVVWYYQEQAAALEALVAIRVGWADIGMRWEEGNPHLAFTHRFRSAAQQLALYGSALRQLDPVSEFLNYCRVIESVRPKKHIDWINHNIARLQSQNFGDLELIMEVQGGLRVRNAFGVLRLRALGRLRHLRHRSPQRNIGKYLWRLRNKIAHGEQQQPRVFRHDDDSYNFGKDVVLMKMLARLVIDDLDRGP